jgi:hypothetical protein
MTDALELDRSVAESSGARRTSDRTMTWLAVLAVVAPFVVAGIRLNLTSTMELGGDAALTDLHTADAARWVQLVGPWESADAAHPGPIWFCLLAVVRAVLGASGTGLVAASLALHALSAALLVLSVGRTRRWERPLLAVVVLLLVLRLPPTSLVQVWSPAALLLPTALALVLAARAATGSLPALVGVALAGTVLVQTDVRTVPLVGLLAVVAVAGLVLAWRRPERAGGHGPARSASPDHSSLRRLDRRARLVVLAGALAVVALWVPPLWQQLRPGPRGGNLGRLAHSVLGSSAEPATTWGGALSGVGQLLGLPVRGGPAGPAALDVGSLTVGAALAVALQLAGACALVWLARRLGRPFVAALGLVLLCATAAGVLAARSVHGPLPTGALWWAAVLPALLVFGAACVLAELLGSRVPGARRRWRPVFAAALVVGAVLATVTLSRGAGDLAGQPGVVATAELLEQAVPRQEGDRPLVLDIRDARLWPTVAGVAVELERSGRQTSVDEPWEEMFGSTRARTGDELWRVTLVAAADAPQVPFGAVIGTVGTEIGDTAVVLSRLAQPAG